jgi:phosphoglycolate phosphatase
MQCNICNNTEFIDGLSRKLDKCKCCGSVSRHRLLWFYLEKLNINSSTRILHIAPEQGIYYRLKELAGDNYITADIDPSNYKFILNCQSIDLTNLESWVSNEFDLIIHSHVLEHVSCNIAYPLFHLHRMLKSEGTHLFVVPFMAGKYEESFRDESAEVRTNRYGWHDHFRSFGREEIETHIGKILNIPNFFNALDITSKEQLEKANIPEFLWEGFSNSTVLKLKKHDYKLTAF